MSSKSLTAQDIMDGLRELNDLRVQQVRQQHLPKDESSKTLITKKTDILRSQIPTSILGHHDRLQARGKPSVARVQDGVCGACHLTIPIGHRLSLRSSSELDVCDNCGVFIYLDKQEQVSDLKHNRNKISTPLENQTRQSKQNRPKSARSKRLIKH